MKIILMAIMAISCGKATSDPGNARLFFSQDIINYGFTRYENIEVICYKRLDQFSCVKKD